jgi:hypothetical protein
MLAEVINRADLALECQSIVKLRNWEADAPWPRTSTGAPQQKSRGHGRTTAPPARDAFLRRFEKEVDPDGTLPPEERRQRAEHAKRAYMLQLAKRSAVARKAR